MSGSSVPVVQDGEEFVPPSYPLYYEPPPLSEPEQIEDVSQEIEPPPEIDLAPAKPVVVAPKRAS